ncbi:MAG: Stp1/IreP family PP2C-type Ser/Thr phosphatase [Nitrospirota bacterium]
MRIAYGAKTDVGLRRAHNEDSHCSDPELGLYVVCDGLGGRNAGEVASGMAVKVIREHLRESRQNTSLPIIGRYDPVFSPQTNRLASAIRLANQAIHDAGRIESDQAGMGTTVVAAVISDQILSIAHVGDSRMYLIRGDNIQPLTADHSVVADQVRCHMLTEEEAERSPLKHIVTRALGIDQTVQVELDEVQILAGDALLLCSDGLTLGVKPAEILRAIRREKEPQAACKHLVDMANAAGGEDNTTVILVTVQNEARTGSGGRTNIE